MAERRQVSLVRAVSYGLGAAVLVGAIAFGVAWFQGNARVTEANEAAEKAKADADARIGEAEAKLDAAQKRIVLLEARRELGVSLYALVSRNFGTAESHLSKARDLLKKAAGPSDQELSSLTEDLGKFKVTATEDVGSQRDRMLTLVERFDGVLPK